MALTRFLFATSLLLLSLLVIVSASDYGYGTKPECDKSKLQEGEKPYHEKSIHNGYGTKIVFDKLKSEEKDISTDNGYGAKAAFDTLKSEKKEDPYHEKSSDYGYGPKPDLDKPKSEEKAKLLSIGVEGQVLCKSGPKYMPIQGAVTRITCPAVDEHGYETTVSVLSGATDAKGYFFATLCPSELENKLKLTECKTFLEKSPLETCKVPTDVNKGINGAHLSSYRILNGRKMKLYSTGPLFYTSEAKSTPNGY